jgi:hypothetical protein
MFSSYSELFSEPLRFHLPYNEYYGFRGKFAYDDGDFENVEYVLKLSTDAYVYL